MGVCGAGDGALGRPAVRIAAAALVLLLGGCSSAGNIIGVVAGGVAGGATANPAVGFGVGVATAAVSNYTLRRVGRSWHGAEQDAVAATAGGLAVGEAADWRIRHSLPIGNEHGHVQVVRSIDNPLAPCKQVLFSVEETDEPAEWYSVDICQQTAGWKWASAEPAVERWGFLQ